MLKRCENCSKDCPSKAYVCAYCGHRFELEASGSSKIYANTDNSGSLVGSKQFARNNNLIVIILVLIAVLLIPIGIISLIVLVAVTPDQNIGLASKTHVVGDNLYINNNAEIDWKYKIGDGQ